MKTTRERSNGAKDWLTKNNSWVRKVSHPPSPWCFLPSGLYTLRAIWIDLTFQGCTWWWKGRLKVHQINLYLCNTLFFIHLHLFPSHSLFALSHHSWPTHHTVWISVKPRCLTRSGLLLPLIEGLMIYTRAVVCLQGFDTEPLVFLFGHTITSSLILITTAFLTSTTRCISKPSHALSSNLRKAITADTELNLLGKLYILRVTKPSSLQRLDLGRRKCITDSYWQDNICFSTTIYVTEYFCGHKSASNSVIWPAWGSWKSAGQSECRDVKSM